MANHSPVLANATGICASRIIIIVKLKKCADQCVWHMGYGTYQFTRILCTCTVTTIILPEGGQEGCMSSMMCNICLHHVLLQWEHGGVNITCCCPKGGIKR